LAEKKDDPRKINPLKKIQPDFSKKSVQFSTFLPRFSFFGIFLQKVYKSYKIEIFFRIFTEDIK